MELTLVQREQAVGDFNVDLLCEDADGRPVIIENQLEKTNHGHLGQVITYASGLEAKESAGCPASRTGASCHCY